MSLFFCFLLVLTSSLTPFEWHYFPNINKYLLYSTDCVTITKQNYINECKKYNIDSQPISITSTLLNHSILNTLITQHTTCPKHNFYSLGAQLTNHTLTWYNKINLNETIINTISNTFDNNNITNDIYIGLEYSNKSSIIQISSDINIYEMGIICELNNNILTTLIKTTFKPIKKETFGSFLKKISKTYVIIIILGFILLIILFVLYKTNKDEIFKLSVIYNDKKLKNKPKKIPQKSADIQPSPMSNPISTKNKFDGENKLAIEIETYDNGRNNKIISNLPTIPSGNELINNNNNKLDDNKNKNDSEINSTKIIPLTKHNYNNNNEFGGINKPGTPLSHAQSSIYLKPKTPNYIIGMDFEEYSVTHASSNPTPRHTNYLDNKTSEDMSGTDLAKVLSSPKQPKTPNMLKNFEEFEDSLGESQNNSDTNMIPDK